ncbi:pilin [Amycolatopsis dongchuanensis]|uniref:TrbC/VIRB2 family protein n=1 Tax=Amycolatopsis dongchuanensis TaxID=1070866 RepID=A0ABP9PVS5_9PSEU
MRRSSRRDALDRCAWIIRQSALVAELVLATLVVTSSTAFADPAQVLALAADVNTVLTNIRNWLMGILALIATVFLTIGGVRYLMASGDPGEVQKAKDAFKNAGIGYGLAALAPVVVTILQQLVGA